MEISDWIVKRDEYVLSQRLQTFPWSTKVIICIEAGELSVPEEGGIHFNVIVG